MGTGLTANVSINGNLTTILGGAGDDNITGTTGPDRIVAGGGSNTINGAGGTDVVTFPLLQSSYTVSIVGSQITVNGPGPTNSVLDGVEVLSFPNGVSIPNVSGNINNNFTLGGNTHL